MNPRQTGDRAVLLDFLSVASVGVAVVFRSHDLFFMTLTVAIAIVARLFVWYSLSASEHDLERRFEWAFFSLATLTGALNDWNSVTRHRVYDYTVPLDFPELSRIPLWMLLYWGLILRFMVTLFHWKRLGVPRPSDHIFWGKGKSRHTGARVAVLVGLALVTRQCIYRLHDDPVWSWVPFVCALAVAAIVLRPDLRRAAFVGAVIVLGALGEAIFIRLGHLHAYRLGWFFGVPLWIALWWGLGAFIWEEVSTRLMDWATADNRRWMRAVPQRRRIQT